MLIGVKELVSVAETLIGDSETMVGVSASKRGNYFAFLLSLLSLVITLFSGSISLAQHETHNMHTSGDVHLMSMPDNDEVLVSAPESIILHFDSDVRLVKLVLKEPSQGKEPIDIGFRYRPGAAMHFEQALPVLPAANYYTAEWTAFDANSTLIKGAFSFSFGDDAKPPSYYRNQMDHEMQILSPDYRLL